MCSLQSGDPTLVMTIYIPSCLYEYYPLPYGSVFNGNLTIMSFKTHQKTTLIIDFDSP